MLIFQWKIYLKDYSEKKKFTCFIIGIINELLDITNVNNKIISVVILEINLNMELPIIIQTIKHENIKPCGNSIVSSNNFSRVGVHLRILVYIKKLHKNKTIHCCFKKTLRNS